MTTIEVDQLTDEAPTRSNASQAFRKPIHVVGLVVLSVAILAAALVLYIDRKMTPTSGVIPTIRVEVGGTVARTDGNAMFADGTTTQLATGETSYATDLGRSSMPRFVSVAVVSGPFEPTWCSIFVDGELAVRKDAEAGGEMAFCSWAPKA